MKKYARVIVQSLSDKLDKFFTYVIPDKFIDDVVRGSVVKVNFGQRDKNIFGFVFEVFYEEKLSEDDLKYINKIKEIREVNKNFFLCEYFIDIIMYIRNKYLCSYYEAISLFLPAKFLEGLNIRIKNSVYVNTNIFIEDKFKTDRYTSIIQFVYENPLKYNKNELSKKFNFSKSSIDTLIKHGILSTEARELDLINSRNDYKYEKKNLNYEQEKVYNYITNSEEKVFLVHGVTGSGKTEIYLHIIEHFINKDGDCIILVPEISLTPQMIERVKGRFNNNVAVYHSKLSLNERYTEWQKAKLGKVKVAIGTRSALFLPFQNLLCIIIDEEHESSYKSENDPKYIAKDIAIYYSKVKKDLKIVLGSATPSVESYYKAVLGKYKLLELNNRANNVEFPSVHIVNMKDELKLGNKSIFSKLLYSKINEVVSRGEQVILFLNKRGFSSFVSCRACGYVYKCKFCDITLTYHGSNSYLICHYCGYAHKMTNVCSSCGSNYVKHFGIGTEKVEFLANKFFANFRVLRMDFDTTRKKDSYQYIYEKIKNREVDIIIGTQMLAKGFDFENITLVGVLAADLSMNIPDYKAYERTFQLLNQVSGRAGRGKKRGEVLIQTYSPESYVIKSSSKNDYKSFYSEEISMRKMLDYPPFSDILNILIQSKDIEFYDKYLIAMYKILKENFGEKYQLLGPSACMISKINDFYRWQIIIKGKYNFELYSEIKMLVCEYLNKNSCDYKLSFDVNPYSIF